MLSSDIRDTMTHRSLVWGGSWGERGFKGAPGVEWERLMALQMEVLNTGRPGTLMKYPAHVIVVGHMSHISPGSGTWT